MQYLRTLKGFMILPEWRSTSVRDKACDRDSGREWIQSHLAALKSALALGPLCLAPSSPWTADLSQKVDHLPLASETQAGIPQSSQLLTFL